MINKKKNIFNTKIYIPLLFLLAVVILIVVFTYVFAVKNYRESTENCTVAGRSVYQSIYGKQTQKVFEKVKESFLKLEDSLSCYIDGSDLDKINSGAGSKWVKVGENTINILDRAHDVSRVSGGIFDITSFSLFKLWGFENDQASRPGDEDIKSILGHVDYNLINTNHSLGRVKLNDKHSLINFEDLLNGIFCENAIDIYKNSGINYGIVSVGSVTGIYGDKPSQEFWKISLKDPFDNDIVIGNIKIQEGYVSTFGCSQDKIMFDGEKINKIVNPKTGMPPRNDILSATVFYSDSVIASALSKICCTVDKEKSFKILNYYGAEAIFVDSSKTIYITRSIYDRFNLINNDYSSKPFSLASQSEI